MLQKKIVTLIRRLENMTSKNAISWKETEREGCYQVSFPNYSIRISQVYERDSEFITVLGFYNDAGMMIEEISDRDIEDCAELDPSPFVRMRELYKNARRNAMGFEKALDKILDDLA